MHDFEFEFEYRCREGRLTLESSQNTSKIIKLFLFGLLSIILGPFTLKFVCSLLRLYLVDNVILSFFIDYPEISWLIGIVLLGASVYIAYTRPIREYDPPKMSDEDIIEEKKQWLNALREQAEQFALTHSATTYFSPTTTEKTVNVEVGFQFQVNNPQNSELKSNCMQTYNFEYK